MVSTHVASDLYRGDPSYASIERRVLKHLLSSSPSIAVSARVRGCAPLELSLPMASSACEVKVK
jgi:hypothetical protein